MPNHSRLPKGLTRILLIALTLGAIGALIVGARTRFVYSVFAKPVIRTPQPTAPPQQVQAQPSSEHIEAELITVRPDGFDPTEIRRGPGPFFLVIENRSGTDLGRLRLEATENGRPVPVSKIPD